MLRLAVIVFGLSLIAPEVSAHGWVTKPVSKNHLAFKHFQSGMPEGHPSFRYEPQSCANGNMNGKMLKSRAASCGATSSVYTNGLSVWGKWYKRAKVGIPTLRPGKSFALEVEITADHGGQAWLMVACGDRISESTKWTFLKRSTLDRKRNFMKSNPEIYAWKENGSGGKIKARYYVPKGFSCPGGRAVGRWLWKTGNTCIDQNNIGRKTRKFKRSEYERAVSDGRGYKLAVCGSSDPRSSGSPETFISCMDFKVASSTGDTSPTPAPTRRRRTASSPVPTRRRRTASSPVPTPAPTPANGACAKEHKQCGGQDWKGPKCCQQGLTCKSQDKWYSQCIRQNVRR